jgi:hypothetical protein
VDRSGARHGASGKSAPGHPPRGAAPRAPAGSRGRSRSPAAFRSR